MIKIHQNFGRKLIDQWGQNKQKYKDLQVLNEDMVICISDTLVRQLRFICSLLELHNSSLQKISSAIQRKLKQSQLNR